MSFSEIMLRRRDARGWTVRPAAPDATVELDDWCIMGDPGDPMAAENRAMAAFAYAAKWRAWQRYMYLRELDFELSCDGRLELLLVS